MIEPFAVLAEDADLPRWDVPAQIERLYGRLGLADECVVANFVESLDGVVAVPRLPRSHAVIGDDSEADQETSPIATVVREGKPTIIQIANSWLILNLGGGHVESTKQLIKQAYDYCVALKNTGKT